MGGQAGRRQGRRTRVRQRQGSTGLGEQAGGVRQAPPVCAERASVGVTVAQARPGAPTSGQMRSTRRSTRRGLLLFPHAQSGQVTGPPSADESRTTLHPEPGAWGPARQPHAQASSCRTNRAGERHCAFRAQATCSTDAAPGTPPTPAQSCRWSPAPSSTQAPGIGGRDKAAHGPFPVDPQDPHKQWLCFKPQSWGGLLWDR